MQTSMATCGRVHEGLAVNGIREFGWVILLSGLGVAHAADPAPPATASGAIAVPDWLFPIDPKSIKPNPNPPKLDDKELLEIPDSREKFTLARINDPFNPPDWRPNDHGAMPEIVAHGRKPAVMACAYCHTPTGQGRPENSALAGLPEAYFKEQLLDLRSGKRKPTGPEKYLPSQAMLKIAKAMTEADIDESAKYFAQQKLRRRVYVIESLRIPRAEPAAWIYEEVPGTEDLEDRLIEVTNELPRHERRDDRLEYTAYVPPGSISRGKRLVVTGDGGKTQPCSTCHLANLKGTDKIPPIAGRSPTYLLRQMLAFRNDTRAGEAAQQMKPVLEKLALTDLIDLAAYLGSLYPPQ
jgi:cytochrome c553